MRKKEYINVIISRLSKMYPDAKISLNFTTPFELLVAIILSAQCTDKRVNIVTKKLFKKYKKIEDYNKVDIKNLEKDIYSTGFYKNKAKNIKKLAYIINQEYKGEIPSDIDTLITLPGIGRKTANVFLANYYKKNVGVIVDTHMIRISNLLHLTKSSNATKIENILNKIVDKKDYLKFSDLIISLGRDKCIARFPKCSECVLSDICPSSKTKTVLTKLEGE
jgi:endonuclease-3